EVRAVPDARGGHRGGALGHYGQQEQGQQQRVQHGEDRGGGDELGERGDHGLCVADQVLGRLGALAGGLEAVGEPGPVVRLELHLRGRGEDLEVGLGGDLGGQAGGGVDGERVRPGPYGGGHGGDHERGRGRLDPLGDLPAAEEVVHRAGKHREGDGGGGGDDE